MLYNLTKVINNNNISDIDYAGSTTKYAEGVRNGNALKALSERLCDNIIPYYMVPFNKDTNKVEYLSKYLAEYTAKIKRILQSHNINVYKRYI